MSWTFAVSMSEDVIMDTTNRHDAEIFSLIEMMIYAWCMALG